MDEFLNEMAEILEEESVTPEDRLADFESWDSLAALSVIAFAELDFGVTLSAQDIKSAETIESLYQCVLSKKTA